MNIPDMSVRLTSKERVMNTLGFKPTDRVPRFDTFWEEFVEKWQREKETDADINDYYGIDVYILAADETPFPSKKKNIKQENNSEISRDGWGRLIKTRKEAKFSEVLEVTISDKSALDKIKFESPQLPERYCIMKEEDLKRIEGRYCVFAKTGGPYLRNTFLRGETQFLMDIAEDPSFAKAMVDKLADYIMEIGLESLMRWNLWDTGVWIYDDIASNQGPMMSPNSFEGIFLPAYKRMIKTWKGKGARKVFFHSDGNIIPLLDMLIDAGIDGIHPIEPKAGMSLPALRRRYGNRLALVGGMCNSFVLPKGSRKEIEQQAKSILEVAKDGGVIIGAHSIGPDVPVDHYDWYHEILKPDAVYV